VVANDRFGGHRMARGQEQSVRWLCILLDSSHSIEAHGAWSETQDLCAQVLRFGVHGSVLMIRFAVFRAGVRFTFCATPGDSESAKNFSCRK
jgi:hypothetical protein